MNKIFTIISMLLLGCAAMQAETVQDYVQDFESSITVNERTFSLPGSWGHIASGYQGDLNTYYPTYWHKAGKGVDGSKCIQVGDQTEVGSYSDSHGQSYDLLVTPEVSGAITIDYKKTNSYSSGCLIEFYYLVPEGDTYTRGELIEVTMPEFSYENFTTVSFNLDTPQRIGIRASYGYIDHFTASVAEVEKKREIRIQNCSNLTEGRNTPVCNEENKFTLKASVTVENTGEAEIAADDPDATVSLCWAEDTDGAGAVALNTVPIGQAIPIGETVEIEIEAVVDCNIYGERAPYGVRDNLSGSYEWLAWITPNLYKPQFQLLRADNSRVSDDDIKNGKFAINYGRVNEATTKKYNFKNAGAGPMVVTSIDTPEGISVSTDNFTVDYNTQQEVEITLTSGEPKVIDGNIIINIEGAEAVSLPVKGTLLDPANYYAGFEDGKFPDDMIVIGPQTSSRWKVENCASSDKDAPVNNYWINHSTDNLDNHDRLITPLLEFAENEQITMDVFKKSQSTSYNSQVTVLWSDDRTNWTEAYVLTNENMTMPEGNDYNMKVIATPLAVTIPAGQHYVAIECNYVYLDDIYGGKIVNVSSELYPTITKTPGNGMVNYEYAVTTDIRNLMQEATTATLSLMVDGKEEASKSVELEGSKTTSATIGYLADHVLENAEAYIMVTAGDREFRTATWNVNILEEVMIAESEIITTETTIKANAPFWTNWYRTQSEMIYPAETLDLSEGDVINSLTFVGYTNKSGINLKMKVWMENTDVTIPDQNSLTNEADMTLVADEYPLTLEATGSNSDPHQKLLTIQFSEPFIYTGGSLRIRTFTLLDEYCSGTNFVTSNDEILKNNAMYRQDDNRAFADEITRSWSVTNAPVVIFGLEVEPVEISGTVMSLKEEGETPLAGAVVTLKAVAQPAAQEQSGDQPTDEPVDEPRTVTYTAVTDETGFYTVRVFQPVHTYTLTATAADHFDYNHAETISLSDGNKEVNFSMVYDVNSGVEQIVDDSIASETMSEGIYNMQGIRLDMNEEDLMPGLYIVNGKKKVIK